MKITLSENIDGLGSAGEVVDMSQDSRFTLAQSHSEVHDPRDIAFIQGYKNGALIADQLVPVVNTDNMEFKYPTFDAANSFDIVDTLVANNSTPREVTPSLSRDPATCQSHGVAAFIPGLASQEADQPYWDIRQNSMMKCLNVMGLNREQRMIDLLLDASNYNAANAATATTAWDAGGDVIADIEARIIASWQDVTGILIGQQAAFAVLNNADVKARQVQYYGDGKPSGGELQAYIRQGNIKEFVVPGLPKFHISSTRGLNAAGGLDYLVTDAVALVNNDQVVSRESISTAKNFRRRASSSDGGWTTWEYIRNDRGTKPGTMIVVCNEEIMKMTSSRVGGHIGGVL